ncbi:type ISP restriction/modification enzyme [Streptomyces sp. LN704]|uniref:type ISP restriction/modification enzyme n=1 Tax=Streptomyces sp. LN704 TaxID=3112982 RepID=UPI003717585D
MNRAANRTCGGDSTSADANLPVVLDRHREHLAGLLAAGDVRRSLGEHGGKRVHAAPSNRRHDQVDAALQGAGQALPETLAYDEDRQTIVMGDGEFGPVTRQVWDYAVGGRNVIKSWFDYRKKEPGGRRSSPLDDVNAAAWDPDWTGEFLDLLSVLTRLTGLEPQQAETLESILTGGIATLDDLAAAGVRWPQSTADRKPRFSLDSAPDAAGDTLL